MTALPYYLLVQGLCQSLCNTDEENKIKKTKFSLQTMLLKQMNSQSQMCNVEMYLHT